jgi:hypothetical protein
MELGENKMKMKTRPVTFRLWTVLSASIVATLPLCAAAAEPTVIVDTKFSEAGADGKPQTVLFPTTEAMLPLKSPTHITEIASDPAHPTTVRVGKETIGGLTSPYALVTVGNRVDKPEAAADAVINWRLDKLNLSSGAYEISYDVLARQTDKGGGRFRVGFLGPDSKPPSLHINEQPASIAFGSKGILTAGASKAHRPYQSDKTLHFVVLVDLDRLVWSMKADGESWVEETPLPDTLPKGSSIASLDFGTRAGLGDQPNAAFAIGNVKMTRTTPATK